MVQTPKTYISSSFKLLSSRDTTYEDRVADFLYDLGHTTEIQHTYEDYEAAQVTDKAIDFGQVVSPTFIFIKYISEADGNGSNADGTHEAVTSKIATSSATTSDTILLQTDDPTNDTLTTSITFSTVANSTTKVIVYIAGRAS